MQSLQKRAHIPNIDKRYIISIKVKRTSEFLVMYTVTSSTELHDILTMLSDVQ